MTEVHTLIGREQLAHDMCALPLAQRLAALLNQDPDTLREGDSLPFGWHGMLFAPIVRGDRLSADGTASDGTFLSTPDGFPRRMAGGRRIEQILPISIGSRLQRRSIITSVEPKSGRSGPMIVATVRHEIGDAGAVALVEEIDTIFLEAVLRDERKEARKKEEVSRPAERKKAREEKHVFGNIELFRFSSVVFNSHRIHYDLQYARNVEGYSELVVNGSLSTLFLCEFARKAMGWNLKKVRTRNLAPLFANSSIVLCAGYAKERPALWVENEHGSPSVEIDVLEY